MILEIILFVKLSNLCAITIVAATCRFKDFKGFLTEFSISLFKLKCS